MFIMFVLFGVINGSVKLNQALTSFITIKNQLKWLWEGGWCRFAGLPGREWSFPGVRSQKWGTGQGEGGGRHGSQGTD